MLSGARKFSAPRNSKTYFALMKIVLFSVGFLATVQIVDAQETKSKDEEAIAKAIATFNDAQDLHEQGLLSEAIALYKKAIQLAGELPEAEFQLGNALLQIENKAEAELAFRRAWEARPEWTLPIPPLARLLVDRGHFDEALALIETGLEREPQNPSLWSEKARIFIATSRSEDQLKPLLSRLKELTRGARPAVSSLIALATLELRLGDSKSAYLTIIRAVDLEPENIDALRAKFEIEISKAQFVEALETSELLARIRPDDISIRLIRARALAELGRKTEATSLLKTIEGRDDDIVRTARSLLIEIADDRASLMELFGKFPNDNQLLLKICISRSIVETDVALSTCTKLISASDDHMLAALGSRAAILLRLGRAADALRDFERILLANPDSKSARSGKALALFNLERWDDARLSFEYVVAGSDELPIAYYYLGIINDKLARPDDALSNYEQFLKVADKATMDAEIERTQLRLSTLRRQVRSRRN